VPVRAAKFPRFEHLRERLTAKAPWCASLVFGALIGVEVTRILSTVIVDTPAQPATAQADATLTRRRPGLDMTRIVAAHLFGLSPEANGQDPASAGPSSTNFALLGTIATQDPTNGVAIISDGGPAKIYRVGQDLGPARLYAVYLNRVVIDRNGTLETLLLPGSQRHSDAGADALLRGAALDLTQPLPEDRIAFNDLIHTFAVKDGQAGKLRGLQIYPGRSRAVFRTAGLKGGDLITAINGMPLDDPRRSQEIWNAIQTSEGASLTVERAGETRELEINLAQLADWANRNLTAERRAAEPPSRH
jgi:general secretion pathway protein C